MRATKWSAVQNAEMRCEDKVSASYVRVDGPTRHHHTLLLVPVSHPIIGRVLAVLSRAATSAPRPRFPPSFHRVPSRCLAVSVSLHVFRSFTQVPILRVPMGPVGTGSSRSHHLLRVGKLHAGYVHGPGCYTKRYGNGLNEDSVSWCFSRSITPR